MTSSVVCKACGGGGGGGRGRGCSEKKGRGRWSVGVVEKFVVMKCLVKSLHWIFLRVWWYFLYQPLPCIL